MALTREFIETVKERADRDPEFRVGMLKDAVDAFLNGEPDLGRLLLRDYVKATLGFEELAREVEISPTSLMRMLSQSGNPSSRNLFAVISCLQQREGVSLDVRASRQTKQGRKLEKA